MVPGYFGFLANIVTQNYPASNLITRRTLGWEPAQAGRQPLPHLLPADPGEQGSGQQQVHHQREGRSRTRCCVLPVSASTSSTISNGMICVNSPR